MGQEPAARPPGDQGLAVELVAAITTRQGGFSSGVPGSETGIPAVVMAAYRRAAALLAASTPGCHMGWALLAGIGRIETGHASEGRVDATGATLRPILGPVLDGSNPGDGVVLDTDRGRFDGNTQFDRAVGPMQFLPQTWATYGADGNGDGIADPNNVYDAALSAGRYLCSGGLDVADPAQARTAVLRYNHSDTYATNVLTWAATYTDRGNVAGFERALAFAAPDPRPFAAIMTTAADLDPGSAPGATKPHADNPTAAATPPAASTTTVPPIAVPPAASTTTVPPIAVPPAASTTTVPPIAVPPAASTATVPPAASTTTVPPAASTATVPPAASTTTVPPIAVPPAASTTTVPPIAVPPAASTTTVPPIAVPPAASTTTVPEPPSTVTGDVYWNYGTPQGGYAVCGGNATVASSSPGGVVSQTFVIGAGFTSIDHVLVQIGHAADTTVLAEILINGTVKAATNAPTVNETGFSFAPITVTSGDRGELRLSFTGSTGSSTTVYGATGSPAGRLTVTNTCSGATTTIDTTTQGLRAVISGHEVPVHPGG
jgi:hypothetical protein